MSFSGATVPAEGAAYLQDLRLFEELCQSLRGLDTNGVATEVDFLHHLWVVLGEMGRDVFAGIELQSKPVKREVSRISNHVVLEREKCRKWV